MGSKEGAIIKIERGTGREEEVREISTHDIMKALRITLIDYTAASS
jgi:hypothetical protein